MAAVDLFEGKTLKDYSEVEKLFRDRERKRKYGEKWVKSRVLGDDILLREKRQVLDVSSMLPTPLSLPGGEQSSAEAERDHYRQHYLNMVLIVKELQQQLGQYKVRCAGVDTFAVMLKEAKQESVTLMRQKKTLETAVSNLQNRLIANKLSPSTNIEETDMYVPGTSKQTLDNLASENARLRSQLKNVEHQSGNKSSQDLQKLKTYVEELESEKNQRQAQLQEMEGIKMEMVQQYAESIESLKRDMDAERLILQREIEKHKGGGSDSSKSSDKELDKDNVTVDRKSVATQTHANQAEVINNLKRSLKHLAAQCENLEGDLENLCLNYNRDEPEQAGTKEVSGVSQEVYQQLRNKLEEVTVMNQRWQLYDDKQKRQYLTNIAQLENDFQSEADMKRQEVLALQTKNANLSQTIQELKQKTNTIDPGYVEILKQQIQVCTEDFNNERKDHEKALTKNKSLQTQLDLLKTEHDKAKHELHELRRIMSSPPSLSQLDARQPQEQPAWLPPPYHTLQHHHIRARGVAPDIPQFPTVRTLNITDPAVTRASGGTPSRASWGPQQESALVFEGDIGPSEMLGIGSGDTNRRQYLSQSHSQSELDVRQGGTGTLASMPSLRRNSEIGPQRSRGVMSCPKCSKEFPEDQTDTLLSHIDACKD